MSILDRALAPPSYGYVREGRLYVPTHRELLREFAAQLNVFRTRKNWLPLFSWFVTLVMAWPLAEFFTHYFSWPLLLAGFLYGMVALGSHGTFWLHRYSTHRAYRFRNSFVRMICRNLVVKLIPEEVYVISHHVHHRFPEKPGDPYNVHAGWLYCFLADANHQCLNRQLCERDYAHVRKLMEHTGVRLNSYAQYRRWGSLCHPAIAVAHYAANWAFWFGAFYWAGGLPLACALFGFAGVWGVGVRTFNYEGHGKGKDRRHAGSDFHDGDLSVNQVWPGFVAGEWHNNHHLYPNGARSGFLRYQLDLPWLLIRGLRTFGMVQGVRDYRSDFMRDYYVPYRDKRPAAKTAPALAPVPTASAAPLPVTS